MIPRLPRLAGRLRRLGARDWVDLAVAQWALLRARRYVKTRPIGALIAAAETLEPAAVRADPAAARRAALAVERAAKHGVLPATCLVRAVALHQMLEARGLRGSRVRVGVGRRRGEFVAHAWVEYGGLVLEDGQARKQAFTPLPDLQLLEHA